MKLKSSILLILISVFILIQVENTNGLEKNRITFQNLSSLNFLEFVKEKQISNRISKICTTDFCDYVRGANIDESFQIFTQKYEQFITKNADSDIARTTILKGFPITYVNVLD